MGSFKKRKQSHILPPLKTFHWLSPQNPNSFAQPFCDLACLSDLTVPQPSPCGPCDGSVRLPWTPALAPPTAWNILPNIFVGLDYDHSFRSPSHCCLLSMVFPKSPFTFFGRFITICNSSLSCSLDHEPLAYVAGTCAEVKPTPWLWHSEPPPLTEKKNTALDRFRNLLMAMKEKIWVLRVRQSKESYFMLGDQRGGHPREAWLDETWRMGLASIKRVGGKAFQAEEMEYTKRTYKYKVIKTDTCTFLCHFKNGFMEFKTSLTIS